MKNPILKFLLPIVAIALSFWLSGSSSSAQTEYFGTNGGLATLTVYSWDNTNWGNASAGPFINAWTNGNFARFYGGGGNSYTVTVNQAEINDGIYNDNSSSTLTINDAGNRTGSLAVTNGQQGFLVTSGSTTIINCPITGVSGGIAGGIVPELSGSLYLGAANTYVGGTALGDSGNTLVYFNNSSSFGPGPITLNRTGNFSTLLAYGGSPITLANAISTVAVDTGAFTELNFAGSVNTPVTTTGTWTLNSGLNIRNSGGLTSPLTIAGPIYGFTNLIFSANVGGDSSTGITYLTATNTGFTGTAILTGSGSTYLGTAYGGGTVAIVALETSNCLGNASSIVLDGGTLTNAGLAQVNSGTLGVTNGTLYLGGSSVSFANSSAVGWSGTLNLADWSGIGSTYGGSSLRIGTSGSGLTALQLADIEFDGNSATLGDAAIDPNGYIYNASAAPGPTFSVTAAAPLISQPNLYGYPTTTTLTITRGGSLAGTITVNYAVSGTALGATNAGFPGYPATYTITPTSGSLVFVPNETSSNITVTAVSDSIARPPTTLTFALSASANYNVVAPPLANITVLNSAKDEVFVATGADTNMYKVFSNDFGTITLTRWGDTNAAAFTVNTFNSSGTAQPGVDFTSSTVINPGDVSDTGYVYPLINGQIPVDTNNLPYTGNKSIIMSVATSSSYTGSTNTASLTIIDSAYPKTPYLIYDPLTNSLDSNNFAMTYADENMQAHTPEPDALISWSYDLYDDPLDPQVIQGYPVPIPFPPNGATNSLRMTVNKGYNNGSYAGTGTTSGGAGAAVNLYYTNVLLSGNYAVRFNMNLVEGSASSYTTEGALFGINHGTELPKGYYATNWFAAGGLTSGWGPNNSLIWESDGIWCWVDADNGIGGYAGGASSYMVFTGNTNLNQNGTYSLPNNGFATPLIANDSNAQFTENFKTNVFSSNAGPGVAANMSPDTAILDDNGAPSLYGTWSDVELKQFNNVITISIDKIIVCHYTNSTTFTNGYLMLGYEDPYSSVGGADAAVYYSNLRAVQLTAPAIGQIAPSGSNYVFNFTTTDGDLTPSSFTVVGASSINGPYTPVAGATIVQLSSGAFQATVPKNGSVQFYRIQEPL